MHTYGIILMQFSRFIVADALISNFWIRDSPNAHFCNEMHIGYEYDNNIEIKKILVAS